VRVRETRSGAPCDRRPATAPLSAAWRSALLLSAMAEVTATTAARSPIASGPQVASPPATARVAASPPGHPVTTEPAATSVASARRTHRRGRLRWAALPLLLLALLGLDLARPPDSQASARLLLGGIHLYQATLSPHMSALGVQCRFSPSCSHYAEGAIARYGALSGSLRAAWRIVRCGPWTRLGTYDPP
jgi:putative membrane protein insertion efficiency factor